MSVVDCVTVATFDYDRKYRFIIELNDLEIENLQLEKILWMTFKKKQVQVPF